MRRRRVSTRRRGRNRGRSGGPRTHLLPTVTPQEARGHHHVRVRLGRAWWRRRHPFASAKNALLGSLPERETWIGRDPGGEGKRRRVRKGMEGKEGPPNPFLSVGVAPGG
eukprot:scaffold25_cov342-Pavlova_lutheri.AAC.6